MILNMKAYIALKIETKNRRITILRDAFSYSYWFVGSFYTKLLHENFDNDFGAYAYEL